MLVFVLVGGSISTGTDSISTGTDSTSTVTDTTCTGTEATAFWTQPALKAPRPEHISPCLPQGELSEGKVGGHDLLVLFDSPAHSHLANEKKWPMKEKLKKEHPHLLSCVVLIVTEPGNVGNATVVDH